jgi:5'-3' exonuclease
MGIPSYFSYIVKNHPSLIKKFVSNQMAINNLYLDCNSIIYDIVKKHDFASSRIASDNAPAIISGIIAQIEEYIKCIQPTTTVFIAFDGVAPVAKMEQQRARRYKSAYQSKITQQIFKRTTMDPFNTSSITPGTAFMDQLNGRIYSHFASAPLLSVVKKIIVSCSDQPGEGEHKLFQHIRDNPATHLTETTVIYGLDADLIMLSINHLPICPRIFLFRETPEFIKSIDASLEPNETYVMDIPELAHVITLDMNNGQPLNTAQQKNRIYDYIFMCFMLGNDFMPHFPAVNIRTGGINKLLNAYKQVIGNSNDNLTDGKTIYWNVFRKFVGVLKQQEQTFIQTEMVARDRREKHNPPASTPEEIFAKFESTPTHDRALEKYINPFKPGWQSRYYRALLKMDPPSDERKSQVCVNYLEGLEWTMKYYTTGCADWRWTYNYHYPPLLEDLFQYTPLFETSFIPYHLPNPVDPFVQLCYVLPLSSLNLLPPTLYQKLIKEHPDWYASDCAFVWAYARYFWEAHCDLPELDIKELEEFLRQSRQV